MDWKAFKPVQVGQPGIKITRWPAGMVRIYFNAAARSRLKLDYIGVFVDVKNGAIALKPTNKHEENATKLTGTGRTPLSIAATKLMKFIAKEMPDKKLKEKYNVEWSEEDEAIIWRL